MSIIIMKIMYLPKSLRNIYFRHLKKIYELKITSQKYSYNNLLDGRAIEFTPKIEIFNVHILGSLDLHNFGREHVCVFGKMIS